MVNGQSPSKDSESLQCERFSSALVCQFQSTSFNFNQKKLCQQYFNCKEQLKALSFNFGYQKKVCFYTSMARQAKINTN